MLTGCLFCQSEVNCHTETRKTRYREYHYPPPIIIMLYEGLHSVTDGPECIAWESQTISPRFLLDENKPSCGRSSTTQT